MVLLARHEKIPGLRAAVKVICRSQLSRSLNLDDDFKGNAATSFIRREVALMKIVAHERVVRLYDVYEHGDQIYTLLEHAPNNSLRHVLAHNIMVPHSVAIEIFVQLVHGVTHLHSLCIAHRDLKPENILVFGPNVLSLLKEYSLEPKHVDVKLSDFELSHLVNPRLLSSHFSGTPRAQPPEIYARIPHRPFPADIWSVGVILYELLYNAYPF
ncbi:kinase-like domain-containing protein, partial [Hysterangium stoloniferum]